MVDLHGGKSKTGGTYVNIQLIHFAKQKKLTQHCKATVPPIKKKKSNKGNGQVRFLYPLLSLPPAPFMSSPVPRREENARRQITKDPKQPLRGL